MSEAVPPHLLSAEPVTSVCNALTGKEAASAPLSSGLASLQLRLVQMFRFRQLPIEDPGAIAAYLYFQGPQVVANRYPAITFNP